MFLVTAAVPIRKPLPALHVSVPHPSRSLPSLLLPLPSLHDFLHPTTLHNGMLQCFDATMQCGNALHRAGRRAVGNAQRPEGRGMRWAGKHREGNRETRSGLPLPDKPTSLNTTPLTNQPHLTQPPHLTRAHFGAPRNSEKLREKIKCGPCLPPRANSQGAPADSGCPAQRIQTHNRGLAESLAHCTIPVAPTPLPSSAPTPPYPRREECTGVGAASGRTNKFKCGPSKLLRALAPQAAQANRTNRVTSPPSSAAGS